MQINNLRRALPNRALIARVKCAWTRINGVKKWSRRKDRTALRGSARKSKRASRNSRPRRKNSSASARSFFGGLGETSTRWNRNQPGRGQSLFREAQAAEHEGLRHSTSFATPPHERTTAYFMTKARSGAPGFVTLNAWHATVA